MKVLSSWLIVATLSFSYPLSAIALDLPKNQQTISSQIENLFEQLEVLYSKLELLREPVAANIVNSNKVLLQSEVPFYSQFTDITRPGWQEVGCGIASIAMLIDYYSDEDVQVDKLLDLGIRRGAYLSDAGWIHSGLIGLSKDYGLDGESHSLAHLGPADALEALKQELDLGPVMASVHYTFEPTNPIPHLVVVHGIRDGKVFYNDPAEAVGNGSISIEKFQRAWKQRYISVRPV